MVGQPPSFRFVDLFAGLGGFHVALAELGGQGVFAAEWESGLNALYKMNFGVAPWSDVNQLDTDEVIAEQVPHHEVLTAGFPCQPFSKSGAQQGFEDTLQGHLFFKVHDILRVKRPSRFVLENVANILKHDGGSTLATILRMLVDLGYEVDVRKLSPHQFGIPQVRERAYFVGSLASEGGLSGFKWPVEGQEITTISTALDPDARPVREVPPRTQMAIDMWSDFLQRAPKNVKLPSFPIWSMEFRANYPFEEMTPPRAWSEGSSDELNNFSGSFGWPLRGLDIAEQKEIIPSHSRREGSLVFPQWKRAFIRQNRDFYRDNEAWIDPWLAQWKPWTYPSSFQKFEWNAQGGVRDIDDYVMQVRASGIRVKRPTTAPALIAMTQTQVPILGSNISGTGARRYMTPGECARLQSLGGITLPANDSDAYKALGNAVNAMVVRKIAETLVNDLVAGESRVKIVSSDVGMTCNAA